LKATIRIFVNVATSVYSIGMGTMVQGVFAGVPPFDLRIRQMHATWRYLIEPEAETGVYGAMEDEMNNTERARKAAAEEIMNSLPFSTETIEEIIAKHFPEELPIIEPGTRVMVNNERYHGEGIAKRDDATLPRYVAVLLGNGNIWGYERETVTPLPAPPEEGAVK